MREDHKKMLSKLFECVTKHEKLHSHLTNMPILLEENWFNTTQKAIKRFMGKCSTMFIKFHEKIKARARYYKNDRTAEESHEWLKRIKKLILQLKNTQKSFFNLAFSTETRCIAKKQQQELSALNHAQITP